MISDKDYEEFMEFIHTEAKKRFGEDDEGNSHIQVNIVDLRTHGHMHYVPLARKHIAFESTLEDRIEGLAEASMNLNTAQEEMRRMVRHMEWAQREQKRAQR